MAVKIGGGHLLILLIMIIDVYCVANLVVEWWTSPPGTPLGTLCWAQAAAGGEGGIGETKGREAWIWRSDAGGGGGKAPGWRNM